MSSLSLVAAGAEPGVLERYVEFVAARCRPNTVLATRSDLRVFFSIVDRPPASVTTEDVFAFITAQRRGDGRVVRFSDGESGLAARTIRRRLAVVSGLFNFLVLCGDMAANPNTVQLVLQGCSLVGCLVLGGPSLCRSGGWRMWCRWGC